MAEIDEFNNKITELAIGTLFLSSEDIEQIDIAANTTEEDYNSTLTQSSVNYIYCDYNFTLSQPKDIDNE